MTRLRAPTRWTLRTRLLLLLVVISALGLGAFGVASVLLLERAQMQRLDTQLGQIAAELSVTRRLPPPPSADGPGVPSDFRVLYFDGRGDPTVWLGESPGAGTYPRLPAMDVLSVRARGDGAFTARDRADDTNWRVRTVVRPATEEQPEEGTAAVAMSLTDSEAISRRLHIIELMIGGALLLLVSVAAGVLVRVGLAPLTRMERTAQAIAAGDLDRRVPDDDPHTETGRLGAALNVMVDRVSAALRGLEESEARMRAFVADASHELRTPLTTVRGYAELYRRGAATDARALEVMGRIEAAAIRMGVLVEDLLLLANLDAERPLDPTAVDLAAVVRDVLRDARSRHPARGITLREQTGEVVVSGDEQRLRQVVTNLIDNAVTHTPDSAEVTVVVGVAPVSEVDVPVTAETGMALPEASRCAVVEVIDTGPGIPADAAAKVFDRFYQVNESRSRAGSSGLGLSIVAAVVRAHHGRVQLWSRPGAGARFRVVLPLP